MSALEQTQREAVMIKSVDPRDSRAVRNLENAIAWNEMMINQKRPKEAIEKYVRPDYIQHNPLLGGGPQGIIRYFTQVTTEHQNARLVYHRAIAAGDYVYCSTTSSTTTRRPRDGSRRHLPHGR